MITNDGKRHIKRYLAGYVPSIAESIALGIGPAAATATDTMLNFEIARADVSTTSYDFENNRLVFTAAETQLIGGTVYEVGIFSQRTNTVAGDYGSRLIASFDSATETWVDKTTGLEDPYLATNSRVGVNGLNHTPATGTTKISSMPGLAIDLLGNSVSDQFKFAFYVGTTFTSSIKFRFLTDSSNYYTYDTGSQTTGYKLLTVPKSSLTATGSPTWGNISEIQVHTTSTGGASAVVLDGIRIDDTDTINPDYVLVARKVLSSPYVVQEGKVQNIEYALDITV